MIFARTNISNSRIGLFTYIGCDSDLANTKIGKFCSIAKNVSIISGNHPTKEYVSTHPLFFSKRQFAGFAFNHDNTFPEYRYAEGDFVCVIGHDVWIGEGVKILNGVSIGNGAIIGAGSVVTKDVEPYSIIVGVPGKMLRKRFSDEQIVFLEKLEWWKRDLSWLQDNIAEFVKIDDLRQKWES
ncbi:MAG TPA: CatB-related O-acetyltransferase [Candidatus Methanofastidiosum sp.]|nr:CatB-related O-acetyltransferase [Methanofastidiosum sp.]